MSFFIFVEIRKLNVLFSQEQSQDLSNCLYSGSVGITLSLCYALRSQRIFLLQGPQRKQVALINVTCF